MELTAADSGPIMIRPCGLRRVSGSFGDQIVAEQGSAGNQGDGLPERTPGRRGGSRFDAPPPAGGRLRPGAGARGSADAHARSGRALRSLISRSAVRAAMRSHRALDRSRLGPPGPADRAHPRAGFRGQRQRPRALLRGADGLQGLRVSDGWSADRDTGSARADGRVVSWTLIRLRGVAPRDRERAGRGTDDGLRTGPGEARGEVEGEGSQDKVLPHTRRKSSSRRGKS